MRSSFRSRHARAAWPKTFICLAMGLASCTADVGGSASDDGGGGRGSGNGGQGGAPRPGSGGNGGVTDDSLATQPLRRLTRTEFNNTVRDLLNDASRPADGFAGDLDAEGTGYAKGGTVAAVDARHLMEAAEALATTAVAKLEGLVPCTPLPAEAGAQDRCATDFIKNFGRRAFRRPLTDAEATAFKTYYAKVRGELAGSFKDGIRLLVAVMLQSPSFLYRWELGPTPARIEGDVVRFNDHEMASRLSYALWATMPDDALFKAADAGELRTRPQIEAQARRLIADPKAKDMIADFQSQWLHLGDLQALKKDPKAYPRFDAALAKAMAEETSAFFSHVMSAEGDGRLATLLTAPYSFLNASLAPLYGAEGVSGGALRKTNLDPQRRAGILTQAAFLTAHGAPGGSHPIERGKYVLARLLCTDLPAPPPNIPEVKPAAENVSTRERFAEHGKEACAVGCHALLDPLGFAFEHYDGIGTYRSMDGGKAVDASGSVELGGKQRTFKDAIELSKLLAESTEVQSCMVKQLLRYSLRRRETMGDEASLAKLSVAFSGSGHDLRELLVAITTSRAFGLRQPSFEEILQ